LGNRLSFKDPKGNPLTYYDYDALRRLKEVVEPGDIHTLLDYDSNDNLISATDGNGNSTSYVFDDMERIYQESSPDRGTTTYQYDPAGNMISKKDARGITVNYSYDALNRLTLLDFPTDTDISYTYDNPCPNGEGRLCEVVDQAGTTTYAYSPKGELVQEDRLILGVKYTTGYQYDGNGNLEVLIYPSGRTVRHVYDVADQVTDVFTTSPGGVEQTVASSISYYPIGPVASMTYGNGLARSAGHDLQYRVTSIQTGTIQDLAYIPDPNGNVDFIDDNLDSSNDKDFSYDALNRLEGATGPWGTLGWTYDKVGNRETYTDPSGTTDYDYFPGTNRLRALTGATIANFTYDPSGNTDTDGTHQYIYNEKNRLASVMDGVILGEYTYDAKGLRVSKTVQTDTTIFHYDQIGNLIGESSYTVFRDYIYLHYEPIAKADDSGTFFISTDHLETPVAMTDSSASIVWQLEMRPFGDEPNVSGTSTLNLRLPGQYYDDELGKHYNNHRYYDPSLGRYLRPDPLGLFGGSLNFYNYVESNPLRFLDREGLQSKIPTRKSKRGPQKPFTGPRPYKDPKDLAPAQHLCNNPGDKVVFWNGTSYNPFRPENEQRWNEDRTVFGDTCTFWVQPGVGRPIRYPKCWKYFSFLSKGNPTGFCLCCEACVKNKTKK
jgi:RHS repeat-associated protein